MIKDGIITTVAGTGVSTGPTSLSGEATKVNIGSISQMAVDSSGNVYFGDSFGLVRKLSPSGFLTTVAGALSGDAAPPTGLVAATSVVLSPAAVAIDGTFLYIGSESYSAPSWYNYLYRVSLPTGMLELMGGGPAGTSGDGGPVSSARFSNLAKGLAAGAGVLYVVEPTHPARIRIIEDGMIANFAGRDLVDGEPAAGAPLVLPGFIATDPTGNIWFTEYSTDLWRIGPDGLIHGLKGQWGYPAAVASGAGNIYLSSTPDQIFKVLPSGGAVLIGGTGLSGHSGDNGPALEATFDDPNALAVDSAGNLYVAEEGSSSEDVRMIAASSGVVTTVAGNHTSQYLGDNSPPLSTGMTPCALVLDDQQNLYIGDESNGRVLILTPGGQLTTFAGGGAAKPGDGGPATSATLGGPCGLALDSSHNLYISDLGTKLVRRVDSQGIITTIAGNGIDYPSMGDGGPATKAQLDPGNLAAGAFGVVYVTDRTSDRIRKLEPAGAPEAIAIDASAPASGFVNELLPAPITIQVTDSTGRGLAGIPVAFGALPEGSASFQPVTTITAADGTASSNVTLGASPGSVVLTATVLTVLPASISIDVQARPSISPGGIIGGALSPTPVRALSPNGLISIFGSGLAPAGISQQVGPGQLIDGHLLPFNLGGVCVRVNSSNAYMLYISPTQLNVQAPTNLSPGTGEVVVVRDCETPQQTSSSPLAVPIQVAAPEFFYLSHETGGTNAVAAFEAKNGNAVSSSAPAHPGDVLTVYGTGFGVTDPVVQAGVIPTQPAPLANSVTVRIGGVTLASTDVLYAGVSSFAGVYQLNVRVPNGISSGDQPIFVTVGGVSSPQGAVLAVATP